MMKKFDTDGFSKTSKVHASKKPLTVAKAPSFSRTTSRAGQTTTSATDPLQKGSPNKSAQPLKPTQPLRAGTPARVARTATPTQSSSRASKAGTPLKTKPPLTNPKHISPGKRPRDSSTPNGIRSPDSENAAPALDTLKADEPGETPVKKDDSKDGEVIYDVSRASDLQDDEGAKELQHSIAVKDQEIRNLQTEIQGLQLTKDAEIQRLQAQIDIQIANEHRNDETKVAFLAQIARLESEIADARKATTDLEATYRKTQEESNRLLGLKDEEIQKLSQAANIRRQDLEAKESAFSPKSEFQKLQTQHKRELDEAVGSAAAVSATLKAVRVERDELIQSRDKEIKEMGDLVQELQEKVEKAHQADKDELMEAKRRHEEAIHGKVEEYEQELRNAATKYEALQEEVSRLERELQNAASKHAQEIGDAKQEGQAVLQDATQKYERESKDVASRHQKEMEDLMLTHHEELKTTRNKNQQASEDSAAKHQEDIEALITKHKEELEAAAGMQEQALGVAAARHSEESQSLERRHLEELRTATDSQRQEPEALAAKHQQEIEAMTIKHQEALRQITTTNEQVSNSAASKSQEAIEAMTLKHREELASATSQIEEFKAATQRHQQELQDVATDREKDLERVTLNHQQQLRTLTTKHDHEFEKAKAKNEELGNRLLDKDQNLQEAVQKYEEEAGVLQTQFKAVTGNVALLESTVRDLLQIENTSRETAVRHEQELQTATVKYEEDLQSLRTISATAVEEITALRRKVETLDQKRSEAVDEAVSLKVSWDDLDLKRSEAVGQLTFLQGIMKDEELERSEAAVEIALLRDKLELADRRFEQDQQAVSDLQRQVRDSQARIAELSTDQNFDQTEAAVDAALFKDKLELADLEIHLHKGTISALQNEIERLQTQLAEDSADKSLAQNEAIVDVKLLKDKLELADIQIRQAKGTVSDLQDEIEGLKAQITNSTVDIDLEQNEAAVEIALLKDTLELANLEGHQNKATIATLRKQITDAPKPGRYTNHQLRGELAMLERHHAAQMTDLESLMADTAAESKVREREWKGRADVWDRLASEVQGMKTQLVGTVGAQG